MTDVAASTETSANTISHRKGYVAAASLALLMIALVYGQSPNFRLRDSATASPYAGDFTQEWLGGYIVRAGDHSRFYDPEYAQQLQHNRDLIGYRWDEGHYLPIVYPPFYYAAISPLSFLPLSTAALVWAGLMICCLAAALALLLRAAMNSRGMFASVSQGKSPLFTQRKRLWAALLPWTLPAAVMFVPVLENLTSSQKGSVCLLILTGTFLLLDSKRPFWAGVLFGLLAFKPQLTLVIALSMLFKRKWSFVIGGALTGVVLIGGSLLVGTDVCQQYFQFSVGAVDYAQTAGYDLHKSHCLYGFFTLLAGGDSTGLVRVGSLLSGSVTVMLLWRIMRDGLTPGKPRFAMQFSSLVIATLLLSPHLFTYDLTILLLPLFLLSYSIFNEDVLSLTRSPLSWSLVAVYALAGLSPGIALVTGLQVSTLLMVAILVILARDVCCVEPALKLDSWQVA